MKPSASGSAIHHEIVTLRQVLKTAKRAGWISGKMSHRAWFSPEEDKQLYKATREHAENPPKPRWKWECEQLHDSVLFW